MGEVVKYRVLAGKHAGKYVTIVKRNGSTRLVTDGFAQFWVLTSYLEAVVEQAA